MHIHENKHVITTHWFIAFALTIFYIVITGFRPSGTFWIIDEGGKYTYMLSTIQSKNPASPLIYPFRQYDPEVQFAPFFHRFQRGDQFYTWWQPGLPLATIPFYLLFGIAGIYLLPAICGGITAGFAGSIASLASAGSRWLPSLTTLIVGLATPLAFYSQMFWEHTLATACLMASIYLTLRSIERDSYQQASWAGLLGAMAVFFRTETGLFLAGFGIVLLILHRKHAIRYGFGLLVGMIVVVFLSYSITQTPLNPNLPIVNRPGIQKAYLQENFISYFLFNYPRMYAYPLSATHLFWGTLLTFAAILLSFIKKIRWLTLLCILGVSLMCANLLFLPIEYRAVQGFLIIAPHILFAFWYFARTDSYKKSPFPLLLIGGTLVFLAVYFYKSWPAAGGLQWGPRYLLSLYPLLTICSVIAVGKETQNLSNHRIYRILILITYLITTAIGLGYSVRGISGVHALERYAKKTEAYMSNYSDLPAIITCDINALIPSIYWTQPVFSILKSDMDHWAANATSIGFDEFYRLSFDLCSINTIDEIDRYRQENPSGITAEICSAARYIQQDPDYCQPLPMPSSEK